MPDRTPREQIRAEAIERLARWEHMLTRAKEPDCVVPPWDDDSEERREAHRAAVSGYVDALGDLLPTGIEWGSGVVEDHTGDRVRLVPWNNHDTEEAAREIAAAYKEPVMRAYTHDWIEVPNV
jgi:hypothetical protein